MTGVSKPHPKGKGCWYYMTIYECVLCSHSDVYRERRWDPKPERYEDRGTFIETACSTHFL